MLSRDFTARRLVMLAGAVTLLAVSLGACTSRASSTGPASGAASSAADTIVIKNFNFQPSDETVRPGATVKVENEDQVTHTLTAVAPHRAIFNTGDLAPGASTTIRAPSAPGSYAYICEIHQFMHGTLVVAS